MKKRKIIIIIILFILGLGLISFGIYNYLKGTNEKKEISHDISPSPSQVDKESKHDFYTPIGKSSQDDDSNNVLSVSNFSVKIQDEFVLLKFDLTNRSKENIENKKVILNFYDNDKIINNFEYEIETLGIEDMITVETDCETQGKKITKYEFEVDGYKTIVTPEIW